MSIMHTFEARYSISALYTMQDKHDYTTCGDTESSLFITFDKIEEGSD